MTQLQAYLLQPGRPLKALLNRKKVQKTEDGRFLYASRPYELLNFQLQPEVVFRCSWDGQQLIIDFEHCKIHGLGRFENLVQFRCKALIRPEPERLIADANLSLELPSKGAAVLVPRPLLHRTGALALDLVTTRLDKRCRTGLIKGARDWISRNPCS